MAELRRLEITLYIAQDDTDPRMAMDDRRTIGAGSQLSRQNIDIPGLSTVQSACGELAVRVTRNLESTFPVTALPETGPLLNRVRSS